MEVHLAFMYYGQNGQINKESDIIVNFAIAGSLGREMSLKENS